MKKINLCITGCLGRMGQQLIKSTKLDKNFNLVSLTESKIFNKRISGIKPSLNTIEAFKKVNVIIERQEKIINKYSKIIPILKAGNMSLGVNLLMYLTEITSKSLGKNFLSKVYEVHHKHKKDYPSGTALMLGKGIAVGKDKNFFGMIGKKYLNKKTFPYSNKINFNSIRKGKIIGEHEVKFSSGKEIVTLNHESFDRALYSEGALSAAKWIMKKKPGLYSMRNLLNFK